MTRQEAETLAKVEVLADLEEVVHQLMITHEAKRVLWFPSELLAPEQGHCFHLGDRVRLETSAWRTEHFVPLAPRDCQF